MQDEQGGRAYTDVLRRLTALDIKVLDISYLYESVRHGTLLPVTQFLFSAIKLAEERRQLHELVAVAEQGVCAFSLTVESPSALTDYCACSPLAFLPPCASPEALTVHPLHARHIHTASASFATLSGALAQLLAYLQLESKDRRDAPSLAPAAQILRRVER